MFSGREVESDCSCCKKKKPTKTNQLTKTNQPTKKPQTQPQTKTPPQTKNTISQNKNKNQ